MEKIIEPSEIIIDHPSIEEDIVHVIPWNRFLARFFDYSIISFFLSYTPLYDYNFFNFIPLAYIFWIPLEATLMSVFGYTPGKFLLRIKVLHKRKKLSFSKSLRRSFLVWLKGVGLGIPIIMLIAMVTSYQNLYRNMKTTWDQEEMTLIVQKPVSPYIIIIVAIFLIGYRFII